MHDRPHVLFVCSRNRWRSPTAARIYAHDPRIAVRAAGLSPQSPRRISLGDIAWADLVMVMETEHARRLREAFPSRLLPPIHLLDIPDDYRAMDPDLIVLLRSSVEDGLKRLLNLSPARDG